MALLTVVIAGNTGATSKPARVLTLRDYGTTIVCYSHSENIYGIYEDLVNLTGSTVKRVKKVTESLLHAGESDIQNYRTKFIVAAEFNDFPVNRTFNALYSSTAIHSAPISLNLITNAVFKRRSQEAHSTRASHITVVNHPLPSREVSVL
jgi:hypothetical protein